VAEKLRDETDTQVDVVNGGKGEFSVSVDGREVMRKGETLPSPEQVLEAVRRARGGAVV